MITRRKYGHVEWIDVISPTHDEARSIIEEFNINPEAGANFLLPSLKQTIQIYDESIYCVLHFPVRKHSHVKSYSQELDFLIGKKYIITFHYEPFDPLEQFSRYFETRGILRNHDHVDSGHIFFEMLTSIYTAIRDEISSIQDSIKMIEPKVFHGQEKESVLELSILNRALIHFKYSTAPHRDIIKKIGIFGSRVFNKNYSEISDGLTQEFERMVKEIDFEHELLAELRDTNDSLLSSKENEIMKNLTMMSFLTFPLSLIVALFDLSKNSFDSPNEFWFILSILIIAVATMIFYFKRRRWL